MTPSFLSALAAFIAHLAVSLALLALFLAAFTAMTPQREVDLIRRGNAAAALGLAGAMVGYAIVLSRAVAVSGGIGEAVVWGVIGLAIQLGGQYALNLLIPRIGAEIEGGSLTAGVMTAATAVTLGLVNAASMTP